MDDATLEALKTARDLAYRKRQLREYASLRAQVVREETARGAKDAKDFSDVLDKTPFKQQAPVE